MLAAAAAAAAAPFDLRPSVWSLLSIRPHPYTTPSPPRSLQPALLIDFLPSFCSFSSCCRSVSFLVRSNLPCFLFSQKGLNLRRGSFRLSFFHSFDSVFFPCPSTSGFSQPLPTPPSDCMRRVLTSLVSRITSCSILFSLAGLVHFARCCPLCTARYIYDLPRFSRAQNGALPISLQLGSRQ